VILFTDDQFHRPGDVGGIPYPGPDFGPTIAALNAKGIKVIGMQALRGGGPSYLPQSLADLQQVAAGTGALAPTGGVPGCKVNGLDISAGQPIVCQIPSPSSDLDHSVTSRAIINSVLAMVFSLP
jgi:hypothetical protein